MRYLRNLDWMQLIKHVLQPHIQNSRADIWTLKKGISCRSELNMQDSLLINHKSKNNYDALKSLRYEKKVNFSKIK